MTTMMNTFAITAMAISISIIVIRIFTKPLFSPVDHITTGKKQRKSTPDLELPTGGGGSVELHELELSSRTLLLLNALSHYSRYPESYMTLIYQQTITPMVYGTWGHAGFEVPSL